VDPVAWTFVTVGTEGDLTKLGSARVWDHEWHRVPGCHATVIDPRYGQSFTFAVYRIHLASQLVEFAAGEFSNGIWGFYLEDGCGYAR
jgi:hypothetical protein